MTQTILITGASNGIGKETALLFAKEGYHLILTYNKDTQNLSQKINTLYWLINNAGVYYQNIVAKKTVEIIEDQIRTNFGGLIKRCHAFLPHIQTGVINLASAVSKQVWGKWLPIAEANLDYAGNWNTLPRHG